MIIDLTKDFHGELVVNGIVWEGEEAFEDKNDPGVEYPGSKGNLLALVRSIIGTPEPGIIANINDMSDLPEPSPLPDHTHIVVRTGEWDEPDVTTFSEASDAIAFAMKEGGTTYDLRSSQPDPRPNLPAGIVRM